jgi:hypothetical protein
MSDKRTVSTDALETLGTIIGPNEKRDAIHLAVIPAKCGEAWLQAADHVILKDGSAYRTDHTDPLAIGIVDPFLKSNVKADENFWLVIYPRVITSLRHVWTHPSLPDEAVVSAPSCPTSEAWLREFCEANATEYDDMIEAIKGGYPVSARIQEFPTIDNVTYNDEFWRHVENVLGTVSFQTRSNFYFECGC